MIATIVLGIIIILNIIFNGVGKDYHYYLENGDVFYMESCLTPNDLLDYLGYKNDGYDVGYAIHIKNLHIFDEPKELNEVYSIHDVGGMLLTDKLKKAPSNMQYISLKEWEYGTFNPNDVAILTSISSECLCKILNGEKTIEIRKVVLKEML